MSVIRKMTKDIVNAIPEETLRDAIEALEKVMEEELEQAWLVWEEVGEDAGEGKWEDASEKHDLYSR